MLRNSFIRKCAIAIVKIRNNMIRHGMQNYIRLVFRDIKNGCTNFISANSNLLAFLHLYLKWKLDMNSPFIVITGNIIAMYAFVAEKCSWKIQERKNDKQEMNACFRVFYHSNVTATDILSPASVLFQFNNSTIQQETIIASESLAFILIQRN